MNSSSAPLLHALSFDIEDWFHMVEIQAVEDPKLWPTLPSLVERRTDEILAICQRAEVRGTFFVLGWVAERYPAMVSASPTRAMSLLPIPIGIGRSTA